MIAWESLHHANNTQSQSSPRIQLQDLPARAIVTGRFLQHQRMIDDLQAQRLMSYHLTDGSTGGYWVPLAERQTTLLAISQTDTELIRGLEASIWKPLSLDSPVIPYAAAGDDAYARRMLETLANREIVEYQSWQYTFPVSTESIFDRDRWGFRVVLADSEQTLQQAAMFRAMGLHYAALRVLFVGTQHFRDNTAIRCEIGRCQIELANAEQVDTGQSSLFRQLAATGIASTVECKKELIEFTPTPKRISIQWKASSQSASATAESATQELTQRVAKYLQGGPTELIAAGDFETRDASTDSQLLYAGLCGAIESGDIDLANRYFDWFENHDVDSSIHRLVQIRHMEIAPGYKPNEDSEP
jgi:hypothetical protein